MVPLVRRHILEQTDVGNPCIVDEDIQGTEALPDRAKQAGTALKIARIAFENDKAARQALLLDGPRKKRISDWLDQTRNFYNNLLRSPDFLAVMASYNYPQAKLAAEGAVVQEVQTKHELQNKEGGEAQKATKLRDAKLAALDKWVATYKKVAEVALAASPQDLEQLGWMVPS